MLADDAMEEGELAAYVQEILQMEERVTERVRRQLHAVEEHRRSQTLPSFPSVREEAPPSAPISKKDLPADAGRYSIVHGRR